MAQLQSTNVTGVLCVNGVAVGGGKDFKYCCYTTSTTFTPSSDLVDGNGFVEAHLIGGGGGGGSTAGWNFTRWYQGQSGAGGEGAAGTFKNQLVTIDSTDACTVTVGAKGDFGWVSGSWGNFCEASVRTQCNESRQKGGDGGNTEFGGFTAHGACGGFSVAFACKGCCTQFTCVNSYNCDAGVVTQAGAYGGFRNSFETETGGLNPSAGSGSEACLNNGRGAISKIGVQGADMFKRCSTGPNCSSDSNCSPFVQSQSGGNICCGRNGCKFSQTFGNGGSTNYWSMCTQTGSPNSMNFQGITSGSDGDQGILVIKWQE